MNNQLYALRIKLASMTDAKKMHALKLKIQQLEKSKSWTIQPMNTQSKIQRAFFIGGLLMEIPETGQTANGMFSSIPKKEPIKSFLSFLLCLAIA